MRTCVLRTGIVLAKNGGALQKMLLPFKLGLGGKVGSGNQWMPWIHRDDLVRIIFFCIEHKSITGSLNCTAPKPVTNKLFTKTLAELLNRPAVLSMPPTIVKFFWGQMG